ncbi:MAG TPA: DUF362 domain-containing protein [Bacteroidales bacterium]|nr:DUF362 domain-containing protein [Bacteroidales bacterium]
MKRVYQYFLRKTNECHSSKWYRTLLFWGLGISSVLWFLIRVIPKPSRASYPCMQAAAPVMSGFVLYLLSFTGAWFGYRKLISNLKKHKYVWAGAFFAVALFFTGMVLVVNSPELLAQVVLIDHNPQMAWGKNNPVGEAKGINPGRVVWAHAPGAADWDQKNGFWFENGWNNQEDADWLIQSSLLSLTGDKNEKAAWKSLFVYFNEQHNKGRKPYKKGEKIAIKINQNNTFSHEDGEQLNASPHLVLSLLRSLVNEGGVPQKQITVFDASRFITNALYNKCHAEFPDVIYLENEGGEGRTKSTYTSNAIPYSEDNGNLAKGLANCVIEADYLINMALLKGHGGQGVTLCAKNWYGTTDINRDFRKNAHNNFNQDRGGKPRYMTFTDFMAHKDLGQKTMLFLIDALYGSEKVNGAPSAKWKMAPFNNSWPCSLFASQDPVAIDAVGIDFLCAEFPQMADVDYCDMYLVEAAMANHPLSGTFYDPERDGTRVAGSLGVLEHWNNPIDKKYSRNLGNGKGIELVYTRK